MRRLLWCFVALSWVFACGDDGSSPEETDASAADAHTNDGAVKTDAGQHADGATGNTGGRPSHDGGVDVSNGTGGSSAGDGSAGSGGSGGSAGNDGSPGSGGNAGSGGSAGTGGNAGSGASAGGAGPGGQDAGDDGSDARDDGNQSSDADSSATDGGYPSDASSCNAPGDCPPPATACLSATCINHVCGTTPVAKSWPLPTQSAGDCRRVECDGAGSTQVVPDDSDVLNDANSCTTDGCDSGNPTHTPVSVHTVCGGGYCDAQGKCAQCLSPADCGTATACATPTCDDGKCGTNYVVIDTPIATQTIGNCKVTVCDGNGGTKENSDDADKPDDSNSCTADTCSSGTPVHTAQTSQPCGASGVCNSQGQCVGCNTPADCGTDDFCKSHTCDNGTCGLSFQPDGTALPGAQQTPNDCKKNVCDANGNVQSIADGDDLPVDTHECTLDQCTGSTPTHPNATPGAPCSSGVCNGSGVCVQCLNSADCGTATACAAPTCDDGKCGTNYVVIDRPIATQTAGNCKVTVCDGNGGTKENIDDADKPDDSNSCTADTCSSGTPVYTALTGQPCGGNGVCSSQGRCVGCNSPADCGTDDFCKSHTCNDGTCGLSFQPDGTALPGAQQTPNDCKKNVCDANGNVQSIADGSDLPVDANECTLDQCSGSTPTHPSVAPETPCSSGVCDGSGACVACLSPADCGNPTGYPCVQATCSLDHHCGTQFAVDTPCGAGASCGGGVGHLASKCNGSGTCVTGATVTCSPYACGANACLLGCSQNDECADGYTCDTGIHTCTNGPKCTDYCSAIMGACIGSNQQYFSAAACLSSCAKLLEGGGDLACRIAHAGFAVADPGTHCPHAGPGGAGVCSASNCDGFCTIALPACTGPNLVYAAKGDCMTQCAAFPLSPPYNASTSSGNSFACRMWHLTAATLDPVVHCPHIPASSPVCVDP